MAGIVMGVAVIIATLIANESTVHAFRDMIDSITGKADFWINGASAAGFPEDVLEDVREIKGVAVANPGVSKGSTLRRKQRRESVQVAGIDPGVDRKLRTYNISAGRFLRNDKPEIILLERTAKKNKIRVGDRVILEGKEKPARFKVVGLLGEEGAGRFMGGKVVFVPLEPAQRLFNMTGKLSYIDAKAQPGQSLIRVADRVSDRLGSTFIVEQPEKRVEAVSEMLRGLQVGLSFFGAIALFVGGFLVFNTFSMVVVEQTQELGILRSLGGSRRQVTSFVLFQAGVLGVISSLIGIAFGIILARVLLQYMSQTVQMTIERLSIPLPGLIGAVSIGVAVTLLAALQPALIAGRISPLAAIRARARAPTRRWVWLRLLFAVGGLVLGAAVPYIVRPEGHGLLSQFAVPLYEAGNFMILLGAALLTPSLIAPLGSVLSLPARALFGENGKLAAGNLLKNPGRTAATASAVMITLAMLIGVGGMVGSFRKSVDRWVDKSLGADVFVSGRSFNVTFSKKFKDKLRRIQGVKDITMIRVFRVGMGDDRVMFRGIEPRSARRFATLQFSEGGRQKPWRQLNRPRRVFISTVTANRRDLQVGDKVSLTTVTGPKDFQVAGVVIDFGGEMGDLIVGSRADMKTYFDLDDASGFRIKVRDGASPRAVAERIDKRYEQRDLEIQDIHDFKDMVNRQVNNSFAIFNVLVLLAAVVAVISVFNTLSMNIMERRREIGVLRAVGATRGQIGLMTLIEAFVTGGIGVLLGLAVGGYLSRDIVTGMNLLTGYDIGFVFPANVSLVSALAGLTVAVLAAAYPARRAATYEIAQAIQYE